MTNITVRVWWFQRGGDFVDHSGLRGQSFIPRRFILTPVSPQFTGTRPTTCCLTRPNMTGRAIGTANASWSRLPKSSSAARYWCSRRSEQSTLNIVSTQETIATRTRSGAVLWKSLSINGCPTSSVTGKCWKNSRLTLRSIPRIREAFASTCPRNIPSSLSGILRGNFEVIEWHHYCRVRINFCGVTWIQFQALQTQ